jgi:hypothetical protein
VLTLGHERSEILRTEAAEQFAALLELADSLPPGMTFAIETRDRNARDVLGHIAGWHQMLLRWHTRGMEGAATPIPAFGYSWDQIADLNQALWRVMQDASYSWTRAALVRTHAQVIGLLDDVPENLLWTPGLREWTRGRTMGEWISYLTARHYEWGIAKMARALRVHHGEESGEGGESIEAGGHGEGDPVSLGASGNGGIREH